MINIIEVYKFDFSDKEKSAKRVIKRFKQYGYPNLTVDLQDAYDGYWKIVNKRDRNILFTAYHSAYIVFYKDAGIDCDDFVKVLFTYDINVDEKKAVKFCDKYEDKDDLQEH